MKSALFFIALLPSTLANTLPIINGVKPLVWDCSAGRNVNLVVEAVFKILDLSTVLAPAVGQYDRLKGLAQMGEKSVDSYFIKIHDPTINHIFVNSHCSQTEIVQYFSIVFTDTKGNKQKYLVAMEIVELEVISDPQKSIGHQGKCKVSNRIDIVVSKKNL